MTSFAILTTDLVSLRNEGVRTDLCKSNVVEHSRSMSTNVATFLKIYNLCALLRVPMRKFRKETIFSKIDAQYLQNS